MCVCVSIAGQIIFVLYYLNLHIVLYINETNRSACRSARAFWNNCRLGSKWQLAKVSQRKKTRLWGCCWMRVLYGDAAKQQNHLLITTNKSDKPPWSRGTLWKQRQTISEFISMCRCILSWSSSLLLMALLFANMRFQRLFPGGKWIWSLRCWHGQCADLGNDAGSTLGIQRHVSALDGSCGADHMMPQVSMRIEDSHMLHTVLSKRWLCDNNSDTFTMMHPCKI